MMIIVGGHESGGRRKEILSFDNTLAWTEVGTLQQGRSGFAAAAVTFPRGHLDLSNCPE